MVGEKSLRILIAEDCEFDVPTREYQIKKEEAYNTEIYKTFPARLAEALRQRGYPILQVDVIREWKEKDKILLPEYHVIISDFQFPTDYGLVQGKIEEIIKQPGMKEKIETTAKSVLESLREFEKEGYSINEYVKRDLEDREALERILNLTWYEGHEGFLPLGLEAKKQGKKVTYYTAETGHGFAGLIVGAAYDLFSPEDVAEVIAKKIPGELVSSRKGNLLVGFKTADREDRRKKIFDRWVRAVEIAIKYQTK